MANRESADRSKQRAKIARVQARQRLAELKSQLTDVQQQLQAMQDSMDVLELVQCAVTGVPAPAATANSLKQQLRHGGIVPPRPSRKRSRSSTQQSPHVMLQPQSEQQHVGHFGRTQAHVQPAAAPSGAHVQQPCRPVAHDSVAHTHPLHAGASTPAAGAVPPVCSARNVQEAVPIKELSPTAASKPAVLPPPQTSAAAHTAGSADRPLVPATCTQQLQQVLPPLISLLQALQQYAEHTGVTAP